MAWASQFGRTGRSTSSGFTIAHVKAASDPNVRRLRAYVGTTTTIVAQESVGPYSGESTNGSTSERVTIDVPSAVQVYYKLKEETSPGSGVYIDISEPFTSDTIIGRSRPIRSDGESFSFGVIGDLHLDGNPGGVATSLIQQRLVNAAAKLRAYGVDFVISLDDEDFSAGAADDYLNRAFTDTDYTAVSDWVRPVSDHFPMYTMPGNHSCVSSYHTNGVANLALWKKYKINPSPENYWTLRWNDLFAFMGLEPYTSATSQTQTGYIPGAAQEAAIASFIASEYAKFRGMGNHHLFGAMSNIGGSTDYGRGGPGAVFDGGSYQALTLHPQMQDGQIDCWIHDHDHKWSHGTVNYPSSLGRAIEYFTCGTATKTITVSGFESYSAGYNANVTMRLAYPADSSPTWYGVWIVDVSPTAMIWTSYETDDGNGVARDVSRYSYTITPRWRKRRNRVVVA